VADYLGKMNALFHEFNEVLPLASTLAEEIEQWSRFFMVVMLHRLAEKYSHVCDQILGSRVIPNFTQFWVSLFFFIWYIFPQVYGDSFCCGCSISGLRFQS